MQPKIGPIKEGEPLFFLVQAFCKCRFFFFLKIENGSDGIHSEVPGHWS